MTPHELQETDKGVLRRAMLLELENMSTEERVARSEKICARVAETSEWNSATRVLLFSPFRMEPQIAALETAAGAGERELFIIPPTLRNEGELDLPFTPDLILVPGLAFTRANHRLGRGGGFYDRLLSGRGAAAWKLGVCFSIQFRNRIPQEEHDVMLDAVISD